MGVGAFPEYLDVLDRLRWTVDVGTQVPHAALRTYVMGDRGADVEAAASADEIEQMSRLCEDRDPRRRLGFTTSRTYVHRTSRGEQIGTLRAGADEVLGIAAALRRAGAGVIQLISDAYQSTDDELVAHEIELLGRIAIEVDATAELHGATERRRPRTDSASCSVRSSGWNAAGADVKAQVAVRPIGVLIGLQATANPFMFCPSYRQLHTLDHAERLARLRDSEVRRTLLAEHASVESVRVRRHPPLGLRPHVSAVGSAGLRADTGRQRRRTGGQPTGAEPAELLYDLLLDDDGSRLLYIPLMNYARGDLDDVREMLTSPNAMFGLSDAGAHCNSICDGSFPTTAITHWTRDRSRGEQLPLEYVVHQQTQRTAQHVGWTRPWCGRAWDARRPQRDRPRPPHVAPTGARRRPPRRWDAADAGRRRVRRHHQARRGHRARTAS